MPIENFLQHLKDLRDDQFCGEYETQEQHLNNHVQGFHSAREKNNPHLALIEAANCFYLSESNNQNLADDIKQFIKSSIDEINRKLTSMSSINPDELDTELSEHYQSFAQALRDSNDMETLCRAMACFWILEANEKGIPSILKLFLQTRIQLINMKITPNIQPAFMIKNKA